MALKFGVWEVGSRRDDWQNLGEGTGDGMFQTWGAQVPEGNVCVFPQDEPPHFHNNKKAPKSHGKLHGV